MCYEANDENIITHYLNKYIPLFKQINSQLCMKYQHYQSVIQCHINNRVLF